MKAPSREAVSLKAPSGKRRASRGSAKRLVHRAPGAVILGAGASSRFPGTKQLAQLGGKTLIERVLDAIPSAAVSETVVVLGHEAAAVASTIRARKGVRVVVNDDYGAGMATSIRLGISSLAKGTGGAMLLLADQPFVTRSLLRRVLRAFEAGGPNGRIVATAYGDVVTPPVVFPKRYFRELGELQGDQGAKSVIEVHSHSLSLVRVRSSAVLTDIDTGQDLEAARRLLES